MAEEISQAMIAELEAGAQEDIVGAMPSRRGGPALAGPDLLHFLAVKLVIPILCGFVKDGLYHAYKSIRSSNQAEQAKKETEGCALRREPVIPVDTLIEDAVAELTLEGIPKDVAERVARSTLERVRRLVEPAVSKNDG